MGNCISTTEIVSATLVASPDDLEEEAAKAEAATCAVSSATCPLSSDDVWCATTIATFRLEMRQLRAVGIFSGVQNFPLPVPKAKGAFVHLTKVGINVSQDRMHSHARYTNLSNSIVHPPSVMFSAVRAASAAAKALAAQEAARRV
jgi:hypothetical protein